jgi:tetratricopeptide (TPR) repeat protein
MCLHCLATSYSLMGEYEEAVRHFKRLLQANPDHFLGNLILTATYSMMGRMEDARAQAAVVMRLDPKWSGEQSEKRSHIKNPDDVKRLTDAGRKAGLK